MPDTNNDESFVDAVEVDTEAVLPSFSPTTEGEDDGEKSPASRRRRSNTAGDAIGVENDKKQVIATSKVASITKRLEETCVDDAKRSRSPKGHGFQHGAGLGTAAALGPAATKSSPPMASPAAKAPAGPAGSRSGAEVTLSALDRVAILEDKCKEMSASIHDNSKDIRGLQDRYQKLRKHCLIEQSVRKAYTSVLDKSQILIKPRGTKQFQNDMRDKMMEYLEEGVSKSHIAGFHSRAGNWLVTVPSNMKRAKVIQKLIARAKKRNLPLRIETSEDDMLLKLRDISSKMYGSLLGLARGVGEDALATVKAKSDTFVCPTQEELCLEPVLLYALEREGQALITKPLALFMQFETKDYAAVVLIQRSLRVDGVAIPSDRFAASLEKMLLNVDIGVPIRMHVLSGEEEPLEAWPEAKLALKDLANFVIEATAVAGSGEVTIITCDKDGCAMKDKIVSEEGCGLCKTCQSNLVKKKITQASSTPASAAPGGKGAKGKGAKSGKGTKGAKSGKGTKGAAKGTKGAAEPSENWDDA